MGGVVVVVGGANVDVKAHGERPLVPGTSNPGTTVLTPGGVGRNVAENLARLGTPTRLVSAVGHDPMGDLLVRSTETAGVDVAGVRRTDLATGTYTAVLDASGELAVAVADMAAVESLGSHDLEPGILIGAALLVLDGNLQPGALARGLDLAREAGVPVVLDPVSAPKAARIAGVLAPDRTVRLLTPTRDELLALTGPDLPVEQAAGALHERGVDLVWVRLGAEGSLLSGPDGSTRLPAYEVDVVDVTGAGDAMLAAFCHALLGGATPTEAAAYGHAAAALTVASPHTTRPDLSDELIRRIL